jgi:hypothetical protein
VFPASASNLTVRLTAALLRPLQNSERTDFPVATATNGGQTPGEYAQDEYTRYVTEPLSAAAVEALRRSLQGNPRRLKVRMPD